jgi:deoxyribodipyrimidine photolyase-related protein
LNNFRKTYRQIRLILGDQLNINHTWFTENKDDVLYVMMEIRPESEYVRHHIQKIVGIFLNMRNFAKELQQRGHHIKYYKINAPDNLHSFESNLLPLVQEYKVTSVAYMEPDEYRVDKLLKNAFQILRIRPECYSTEHFYTERNELTMMFPGSSSVLMEHFYRKMRKKHQVLMNDAEPTGAKWNYDKSNRKKLPKNVTPPPPMLYDHDVSEIMREVRDAGLEYIGEINERKFSWPGNRSESLKMLEYFNEQLLVHFGTYQDALSNEQWSLFHSRLSFAMNLKLISPKEIIESTELYWQKHQEDIDVSQVEGFIRQILGWREFMRGIYWKHMPGYEKLNYFNHQRSLPAYFWNGKTGMQCVSKAVNQSLKYGYAHHIQRLMVTGNFTLLAGIHPDEVDAWYLGIYTDAYHWVQVTNTRGMSQFADGGIVGTKPYISSGSYINKMGDHCRTCKYDPLKKYGKNACPFNSLYWRFLSVNENKLASNQRMTMMYRVWHKMDPSTRNELIDQANYYLDFIEDL